MKMLRGRLPIFIVAFAGLALVVCIFLPGNVNNKLEVRSVPKLGGTEKILGVEDGGLFAKYLFVAARMTEEAMEDYRNIVKNDGGERLRIGDGPEELLIIKDEQFDSNQYLKSLFKDPERKPKPLQFERSVNGEYLDWWATDKITDGERYEKNLPDSCGYSIYFDNARKIVFIYWHYS